VRIALLIPPSKGVIRDVDYGCWHESKIKYSWPPIGPLYIASISKAAGHDIKVFDFSVGDVAQKEAVDAILGFKPQIILFESNIMTLDRDLQFIENLKKLRDIVTICYGAYATTDFNRLVKFKSIDYVIIGEVEAVILDLLEYIDKDKVAKIKGVCHKKFCSGKGAFVQDIDDLPFPDRSMVDHSKYYNPFSLKYPFTTAITSRGCPYKCIFCTSPVLYGHFRQRSTDNVLDELLFIKKAGFKEVFFRDENLTLNKAFVSELCTKIEKQHLGISWMCNSRIDSVDRKTLAAMRAAGCHLIKFGVESGSQKTLDRLQKNLSISRIKEVFELCRELGIQTVAHFMLGNPGEDDNRVMETITFSRALKPDYVSFDIFTVYPGTPIYKELLSKGITSYDEIRNTGGRINEKFTELSSERLEKLYIKAFNSFYKRPEIILKHAIFNLRYPRRFLWHLKGTSNLWGRLK
jgi:radical SAM superfamily enzyme YgiQ (UPF0313 family)